jgi:molecular chaperone DnaK
VGYHKLKSSFDIDANGIINVSAIDKATNKSQEIKITAGSGLTEEEIKRMIREADENRESDSKRREIVDARNNLEGLIAATEKMLKEGEGKIAPETKAEIESAIEEAKQKQASEILDELKAATERLQNASHKAATEMYQQGGGEQPGAETAQDAGSEKQAKKDDDDVVDADYKEV